MKILFHCLVLASTWPTVTVMGAPFSLEDLRFSGKGGHRRLQQSSSCSSLETQVNKMYKHRGRNVVKDAEFTVCEPCTDSEATCYTVYGRVCENYPCGVGEDEFICMVNVSSLEVCQEPIKITQWSLSSDTATELSRTSTSYYTRSTVDVVNLTGSWTFGSNKQPESCEFYVDGIKCNLCLVCNRSSEETVWPRTFDCSNVAANATLECGNREGLTDDLTSLDATVTYPSPNFTLPRMPTSGACACANVFTPVATMVAVLALFM